MKRTWNHKKITQSAVLVLAVLWLFILCRAAFADSKNIDKLRKFYRDHNLDFYGELIVDQSSLNADEQRHAKLELLADEARTQALTQLERLLSRAKGEMAGELLLRKATLLSDRARTATYFQNNPFKASKLKAPNVYLQNSVAVFQTIEKQFPSHPKMDVVLFSIGYNYGELKNVDAAFKYYEKVVSRFPASPLVGDARLSMAEILFDKRKFTDALRQLQEIVKAEHPRLKNFALYKMAWTYYNLTDLDSAIHSLERVVEGVNSSGVQTARLELRKEALNDLVAFYAESQDSNAPQKAMAYFEKVGTTPAPIAKEYAAARERRLAAFKAKNAPLPEEELDENQLTEPQEMLFRLVHVYREQGKHEQLLNVTPSMIAALAHHPRTPALYRVRAESAEKLRRRELVISELEKLAQVIEKDLPPVDETAKGLPVAQIASMSEYFKSARPKDKQIQVPENKLPNNSRSEAAFVDSLYRKNLSKIAFDTFKDFSGFMHGEWMKTQNVSSASAALRVYDLAIRSLLNPWRGNNFAACIELVHQRAELLFAQSKLDLAAQDYHWLVEHSGGNDALKGEIASLEAYLKASPIKIVKGEMHQIHRRLSVAYDNFLAFNIADAKARKASADIVAASARLYKEYGNSEEALRRMMFYTRTMPEQKDAIDSTRDVLAILEKAERWEELRDYSDELSERGSFKKTPVDKDLTHSYQFASLKLLEKLEKEKDWKKAQREFATFAAKNPDSPFASQALMKSAVAALETKDPEIAIQRLEEATHASDPAVRLQAWLGLESYYRKAFQWKKLETLYTNILGLKAEAKAAASAKQNLASIAELKNETFAKAGEDQIHSDPELEKLLASQEKFEHSTEEYRNLRFVKSNNNPSGNFKKKADQHAKLAAAVDRLADDVPKLLRSGASIWANVVKAELLLELAETIDKAAVPSILAKATEADRKSYRETLDAQTKEVRVTARKFVEESAKTLSQIDYPAPVELRLNKLLEYFNLGLKFERPAFTEVWKKRPNFSEKPSKIDDRELAKIGIEILKAEDTKKQRSALYDLAQAYYRGGELGYAYAVASTIVTGGSSDEWTAKAARVQFEIDLARMPHKLSQSILDDSFDCASRWNLARWIAKQNTSKADFSKDDAEWFTKATQTLLRTVKVEIAPVSEAAKLSQAGQ